MSERADSSATVILSPSRNSTSTTTASLEIPKGLKGLLDDITKEVLNLSPESHQLYKVCADYLERRLIERDPSSLLNTPVRRPPLRMISTYTTDSDSGLDVGATPIKGKFGSSKVRTHTSDWCQSSNRKGGTVPPIENIQERGLLLSTSDFEEDTTEGTTSFPTKKKVVAILLLNESGKLSPLYPPNSNDKEDFTPSEELKEIRLETLRRAKLPISVHFTNEKALLNDFKSSQDLCPPLRLFINPEKPLLSTKDGCVQTSNSPPPVQDDVVARVLLEHAEEELDEIIRDPRRTVNYLDLSKLGEEGETPASDEIWLPLGDEDKFLSSDTDTFSIGTDKLSNIANMSGDELPTHSPMETENYSKFMGPIQEGLAVTSQNVLELSGKFKDLENTLRDLCQTVEEIKCTKTKQMDEIIHKMNEKCIRCSSNSAELKESTSSSGVKSKTITDTKQIADQLREDNSLLRQDLQRFRDRENKLFDRLEGLEHRLLRVNLNDSAQTSPPSDRSTFPLIQTELKKTKEFITNTVVADTEEIILPIDVNKSRRLSNDSRSSSAGNTRITAKLRPINDITLARSDNTILRQDIQICRERESQLLMRTIDLEDKIIKAASEDDTSNKKKKVKPEVNINIDFSVEQIKNGKNRQEAHQTVKVEIQDDKLPGKEHLSLGDIKSPVPEKHSETERQDPPLASSTESEPQIEKIKEIEAPKALLESKPSKFKESKVSKPSKSKNEEIISPSSSLTSKEEPKKSSKTTSHSKKEETSKLGKKRREKDKHYTAPFFYEGILFNSQITKKFQ
ncbi:unnamed protein product [Lepeophtheirus salmonis]|uniref:(salmon louse) hypothetical protein n=2 Tax=Lepeophtheirus salmonis TaxID=72036 RepID=A0A7R8CSW4_LEPSM|nr:unnamed protein product [Lepeophtheirus salmonis]CAF2884724.1 unnamed protein product [Lepeophtheirus salmonis]